LVETTTTFRQVVDAAAAELQLEGIVGMPFWVLVDTILPHLSAEHLGFQPLRGKLNRIARELRLDRGSMYLRNFVDAALGMCDLPRGNNIPNDVDMLVLFLDQLAGQDEF
jgi:hypothetical protein